MRADGGGEERAEVAEVRRLVTVDELRDAARECDGVHGALEGHRGKAQQRFGFLRQRLERDHFHEALGHAFGHGGAGFGRQHLAELELDPGFLGEAAAGFFDAGDAALAVERHQPGADVDVHHRGAGDFRVGNRAGAVGGHGGL